MGGSLHQLIGLAFGGKRLPAPVIAGRRRKKLWELPSRCHCPLVGACLPVADMRKIAAANGIDEQMMSEYSLHTLVVGSCDARTAVAEAVQRFLERRHLAAVQRFGRQKGEVAVLALWREAVQSGADVAGALWAAWTHADMSEEGSEALYGDLHMLSHQVGAAARADLRRLETLKQDNVRLRAQTQALRLGLATAQRDKDRALAGLQRQLADAEQRAALLGRRELELTQARQASRDYAAVFDRAAVLAIRVEALEERNADNARRAEALASELNDTRDALAAAEAALATALGIASDGGCDGVSGADGCGRTCPAEQRLVAGLANRCVLCIGGRTGLVDGYRRLVEAGGGRFLHHDGGQEESLHRITAAVAGADAVVCQSGCVSHAAYYRLKDACKKLGKPCVFLKSPGIGSFARGLAVIAEGDGSAMIRLAGPPLAAA